MSFRLGRFGIKAKQVIGVTLIVTLAIAALTTVYLGLMVRVWLTETRARGELVAKAAYQRAFAIAAEDTTGELAAALERDPGLRSILEASLYSDSVTFAALVDARGRVIAHNDPTLLEKPLEQRDQLVPGPKLDALISAGVVTQLKAIYTPGLYDVEQPLMISGGSSFGAIHVGVSTLLIRSQINGALSELRWPVLGVLLGTVFVAMLLANIILRPISVISSGVARLGRGEFDAEVDLPGDAELRDVSESIKAIGARLAASGTTDATSRDARRLVALSRLSAGIAHEIKNPLNAMSIHLELLRTQLASSREAAEPLAVITSQLRRLDDVVQTFLKFSRPEALALKPTSLLAMLNDIKLIAEAEGERTGVKVAVDCPADLPDVMADATSLSNALLNLALNGCQAMPDGGSLRMTAKQKDTGHVSISIADTGVGIPADQLDQIFNLYFTTKEGGSGIGLAMVYRTVQLHDGDIAVESAPGRGTTFTVSLPVAPAQSAS